MNLAALRNRPVVGRINDFLASPGYILLVMVSAAVANLFSLELPVYTVYVLIALYSALLGRDLICWVPLVVCGYLAPSRSSNPGKFTDSIFRFGHGGEYVLVLAGFVALALVLYVCRTGKGFFRQKRKLLPGLLLLSGAYFLGGLFSPAYPTLALRHWVFATLQAVALIVPYFVISGGICWERSRKDFFCLLGFGVGCLLVVEILGVYLTGKVTASGSIDRYNIYTGWGMHNNLGGMLAMMIPFAFYMGHRWKQAWLGILTATGFWAVVAMTCSRSSMFMGAVVWVVCLVLLLRRCHSRREWVALGLVFVLGVTVMILFQDTLARLFRELIQRGASLNFRDQIWSEGWKQFGKYPVFGGSFMPIDYVPYDFSEVQSFSGFFPPRWHSTIVQLAATTGVVGLAAYGVHRAQTVRLVRQNRNPETLCLAASMLVLVLTCLFDSHFFNLGPVLFYSMALAFMEKNTCIIADPMV